MILIFYVTLSNWDWESQCSGMRLINSSKSQQLRQHKSEWCGFFKIVRLLSLLYQCWPFPSALWTAGKSYSCLFFRFAKGAKRVNIHKSKNQPAKLRWPYRLFWLIKDPPQEYSEMRQRWGPRAFWESWAGARVPQVKICLGRWRPKAKYHYLNLTVNKSSGGYLLAGEGPPQFQVPRSFNRFQNILKRLRLGILEASPSKSTSAETCQLQSIRITHRSNKILFLSMDNAQHGT